MTDLQTDQPSLFDELPPSGGAENGGVESDLLADGRTALDDMLQTAADPEAGAAEATTEVDEDLAEAEEAPDSAVDSDTNEEAVEEDEPAAPRRAAARKRAVPPVSSQLEADDHEDVEVVANPNRRRNVVRAAVLAGAVIVAGVLGTVGANKLNGSNETPVTATTPKVAGGDPYTEVPGGRPEVSVPETTVGSVPTTELDTTAVENDTTTGLVRTTQILSTDKVNAGIRPNGDVINVPASRAGHIDTYFVTSGVLANMAAAMTIEDNDVFLDQLTTVEADKSRLENDWANIRADIERINHPNTQASIFDDPENPIRMTSEIATDGTTRFRMIGGDVYVRVSTDFNSQGGDWQAPFTHTTEVNAGATSRLYKITSFQYYINKNPDGTLSIRNTYYELEPVTASTASSR